MEFVLQPRLQKVAMVECKPGSPTAMTARANTIFRGFLVIVAILGGAVILLNTSRMGPGVSTDSAMLLSTAQNLTQGRGLVDYTDNELTQFPPLYPGILALGSLATGLDVFVVGWYLNVLVFCVLIWLTGRYVADGFGAEPILAYIAALVVLTSVSLIKISSNIASDPLFMVMLVLFLMSFTRYLDTGKARFAALAGVLAIAASFQRYAGLALAITGSLVTAYELRHRWWRALSFGALFGLATASPILAWGLLHNFPRNATVLGARLPAVPFLNFVTGAEKVLRWFIPYRFISGAGTLALLAAVIAACALLIAATGAKEFGQQVRRSHLVPSLAFLLVYGTVMVFGISYYELKGPETDRVHIMMLTPLLLLLAAIGLQVLQAGIRKMGRARVYLIAAALFLAWSTYPISRSAEYLRDSMAWGDVSSYNSINKGAILDSPLAHYLKGVDFSGREVYTNGADTAWFILRRQVVRIPWLQSADRITELRDRFPDWPGAARAGYVLWINAESSKTFYATPEELGAVAQLTLLYQDDSAVFYSVRPYK